MPFDFLLIFEMKMTNYKKNVIAVINETVIYYLPHQVELINKAAELNTAENVKFSSASNKERANEPDTST